MKSAFSLVEVLVAIVVAAVLSIPILLLMTSSRTGTSNAVNYLRALEIAHETIEWINATPLSAKTIAELKACEGSLVVANGSNLNPGAYPIGTTPIWSGLKSIKYPGQYSQAYFFRKIEIEPITDTGIEYRDYLHKVEVTILWNEGKIPGNIGDGERNKKIVGTVNLNQMQEARLALSYLRRDFGSASPYFLASDTVKVRMNPIKLDSTPISDPYKSSPIQITPTELVFYRFIFDNPIGTMTTTLEQVTYTFDSSAKTLTRRTPNSSVSFTSIKNVNFGIYVHKANPNVPILNVRLEVLDEKTPGSPQNIAPLELCTSITSAFMNSNLNNLAWSYSPYQQ